MENNLGAPPTYNELFGAQPSVSQQPIYPTEPPPPYSSPVIEGYQENVAPSLAYADFLPKLMETGDRDNLPVFDDFKSIIEIVNDWLLRNQNFRVIRCECIDRKIKKEGSLETESTVHHESANGLTVFVRGIRLWLRLAGMNEEIQQIGYVNLFPAKKPGMALSPERVFVGAGASIAFSVSRSHGAEIPVYETIDEVVTGFNSRIRINPLPGKILSVDTIELRHTGSGSRVLFPEIRHPDQSCWSETGNSIRFVIHCLRVFFINGAPNEEEIVVEDFAPKLNRFTGLTNPIFEKYSENMKRASKFIHNAGISVKNIQTVVSKVDVALGEANIDTRKMDYYHNLIDTIFVKVIRVISIKNQSVNRIEHLSSKCFVPARSGKEAEPMGVCIEEINNWLRSQNVQIIGIDTLLIEMNPEARSVRTDNASYRWVPGRGHYKISSFRVYLNGFIYDSTENSQVIQTSCCTIA